MLSQSMNDPAGTASTLTPRGVQHGVSLHPGEIGIFTNGDSGYIKVYQRDGLHSLNPAYPTMHFNEGDDVRCVGKVLGIAEKELFASEDEVINIQN